MKNDGGAAFPRIEESEEWSEDRAGYVKVRYPVGGMSLRDYFAAACMADVLGHANWTEEGIEHSARMVWKLADAMLKAREP